MNLNILQNITDEQTFHKLVLTYEKRFYAVAFKMLRNQFLAEEVVQNSFLAIWQYRRKIFLAEKPEEYIFKLVYNQIFRQLKKLAKEKMMVDYSAESHKNKAAIDSLYNDIENKNMRRLIKEKVQTFPGQQQLVYNLIVENGLSRKEAAQYLGISSNTVKNHLQQVVNKLREFLKYSLFIAATVFFLFQ